MKVGNPYLNNYIVFYYFIYIYCSENIIVKMPYISNKLSKFLNKNTYIYDFQNLEKQIASYLMNKGTH